MYVAEIQIHEGNFMSAAPAVHTISFDDLDAAYAEYDRLVDLMSRKEARSNDLPKVIECAGPATKISIPLASMRGIGLFDFAKSNDQRTGLSETFPYLFKT